VNQPFRLVTATVRYKERLHMKIISLIIFTLFLSLCFARAADTIPQSDPVLLKAEMSIRLALADIDPEPLFEYPKHTKSLIIKYRTRKFMIHNGSMIGKYSKKAHEEEGPGYKGFMLAIHLQKAGTVNQAEVPQTIQGPYWKTDLNITVAKGTNKQLYWGLSYGNRVDSKLLKRVRSAINALGKTEQSEQKDALDKK
jgi:hypothetical protein